MIAADSGAANASLAEEIASAQRGHLAAQRAMWRLAQREGGQELIDQARAELADDPVALAAFGRSLVRGREVGR